MTRWELANYWRLRRLTLQTRSLMWRYRVGR